MLPKTEAGLEREHARCKRSLVSVAKESFKDYFEEAYSDLESAEKEKNGKWAMAKAYQALFLYANGMLVRKAGFYSKDHGCVLVELLWHKVVPQGTLEKIRVMLKEKKNLFSGFFEEMSQIRIARNRFLYIPNTQRKLNESPQQRIKEVREIIKILSEIE